jgi:hypothetical protein
MRRLTPLAALACAAALVTGCARAAPQPADPRDGIEPVEQEVPVRPVVMYFVNSSTVGADVFATANPRDERRLGTVQPGSTSRFELPREAVRLGSTNVVARLHPSTRSLQTGTLTVNGGDVFTVSLGVRATTLDVTPGRP